MSLNTSLIEPEIFKIFAFWGIILALKLVAMVPLTAYYRFKNKVCLSINVLFCQFYNKYLFLYFKYKYIYIYKILYYRYF